MTRRRAADSHGNKFNGNGNGDDIHPAVDDNGSDEVRHVFSHTHQHHRHLAPVTPPVSPPSLPYVGSEDGDVHQPNDNQVNHDHSNSNYSYNANDQHIVPIDNNHNHDHDFEQQESYHTPRSSPPMSQANSISEDFDLMINVTDVVSSYDDQSSSGGTNEEVQNIIAKHNMMTPEEIVDSFYRHQDQSNPNFNYDVTQHSDGNHEGIHHQHDYLRDPMTASNRNGYEMSIHDYSSNPQHEPTPTSPTTRPRSARELLAATTCPCTNSSGTRQDDPVSPSHLGNPRQYDGEDEGPDTRDSSSPEGKSLLVGPVRHLHLVILAHVFFVMGSASFVWASYLENHEDASIRRSRSFLSNESEQHEPDDVPENVWFRLEISSNMQTWVTQRMLLMLVTMFCFSQVGIIQFIRAPWDKFHAFQIMGGAMGLVSAMFWETKTILSNILYFFFVHAMTGQAILQVHAHYYTMIKLPTTERAALETRQEDERQTEEEAAIENVSSKRKSISRRNQHCQSPIMSTTPSMEPAYPSGLWKDDREVEAHPEQQQPPFSHRHASSWVPQEQCFSVKSGERGDNNDGERGGSQRKHSNDSMEPLPSSSGRPKQDDEACQNRPSSLENHSDPYITLLKVTMKYGRIFCLADALFLVGSLLELALTYVVILDLPDDDKNSVTDTRDTSRIEGDDDVVLGEDEYEVMVATTAEGEETWSTAQKLFNILPGILWLLSAIVFLFATILLRRNVKMIMKGGAFKQSYLGHQRQSPHRPDREQM